MIPIKGQVNGVAATSSALSMIPSLLVQAALGAMTEGLEIVSQVSRAEYLSGPYPQRLQNRTGRLRASMRRGDRDNTFRVSSRGSVVTGELGTSVVYARIHETGGIIRPRKGQYLAIPTQEAMTPRGVVRAEFSGPLRGIPGLFLQRNRSGNLFAARRRGRRGALQILFNLVRSVTIPARPFLKTALTKAFPQVVERFDIRMKRVVEAMNETLRRVGGRGA